MGLVRGHLLTLATLPGGTPLPLSRVVEVETSSVEGVHIDAVVDDAFRAAAEDAWRAARRATGRDAAGVLVRADGVRPLAGGSGGHALGILIAAALRDRAPPAHFAVGFLDAEGRVRGGGMAAVKARAAEDVAAAMAPRAPVPFLYPEEGAEVAATGRLAPRRVADLETSLVALEG